MKKKHELKLEEDGNKDLEIIKAVAQAWHCHSSGSSRPINEFDAYRRNFKAKPSRFKLEAMSSKPSVKLKLKDKDINIAICYSKLGLHPITVGFIRACHPDQKA
ncbi:hypothetical protein REPUB_Repub07fG0002600 [Reevesia pubescens]